LFLSRFFCNFTPILFFFFWLKFFTCLVTYVKILIKFNQFLLIYFRSFLIGKIFFLKFFNLFQS
jgi:hypothetical protein